MCQLFSLPSLCYCAVGLLLLVGCGRSTPSTVPVHGRITCQGKPLATGVISFVPQKLDEGMPRRTGSGRMNPDGTFRVSTFRQNDGLLPGAYQVAINTNAPAPFEGPSDVNPQQPRSLLPSSYALPHTSGLTATIPPQSAPFEVNFDLTQ